MRAWLSVSMTALLAASCGNGKPSTPTVEKRDGGVADAAITVEIPAVALGLTEVSGFLWRQRAGHPLFREARTFEAAGDWPGVVTACKQALAADPTHLEAAWLLAVGYAKTGKLDEILAPLQLAAAGDFGKWGHASLELPSLQPWLKTPQGQAWQRRVELDRAAFLAAIDRAIVVNADGDLFGYDLEGKRWYRLTRTFGALYAALAVEDGKRILYLTRQRATPKATPHLALGMVDFARGRTSRPISVGAPAPAIVTYASKPEPGAVIATGLTKKIAWQRMDDDGKLTPLPPKTKQPPGRYLSLFTKTARLVSLPVPDIAADWDGQGLASAIKIGKSARVVMVPPPGLIDGNTIVWSPSKTHIAFVAQLDDRCPEPTPDDPGQKRMIVPSVPNAAAFVADVATASLTEIERAVDGLVVEWVGERSLAVAGDHGVTIVDLDGAPPVKLAGADGLVSPRRKPKCLVDPLVDDVPIEDPEPAE